MDDISHHLLFHSAARHNKGARQKRYIAQKVGLEGAQDALRIFGNDPTAGSPTVTLLRLLLPLNDQV